MLIIGYPFKPNTEATVAVGPTQFAMYTQNDGAWVKNAAEETRLVDTMRKGADVVVKAQTSPRHQTTDTFSLKGPPRRSIASHRSASESALGDSTILLRRDATY